MELLMLTAGVVPEKELVQMIAKAADAMLINPTEEHRRKLTVLCMLLLSKQTISDEMKQKGTGVVQAIQDLSEDIEKARRAKELLEPKGN